MPTEVIPPEELIIQKLHDEHALCDFECIDDELNDFILNDASVQREARLNQTYICKYENKIVAFFTVSSDSIEINPEDKERIGVKYPAFPAIKIGRLAVDKNYQRRNIASNLISYTIGLALELADDVGVRFISVDSYYQSKELYRKNFFVELAECEGRHISMYTDLEKWLD